LSRISWYADCHPLMRPEYGVESFGDGEGQEEIGNGQEAVELFFQPEPCFVSATFWATAVIA